MPTGSIANPSSSTLADLEAQRAVLRHGLDNLIGVYCVNTPRVNWAACAAAELKVIGNALKTLEYAVEDAMVDALDNFQAEVDAILDTPAR